MLSFRQDGEQDTVLVRRKGTIFIQIITNENPQMNEYNKKKKKM